MPDTLDIVDSISATPTVLVSFTDFNPLSFNNWNAPPAKNDGPVYLASSHGGRVIDFDVNIISTSDDLVAAALQKVARLISRGGQWLRFKKAGATVPVFFRLRRADITSIQEFWTTPGTRVIHLSLPADPFAYGLAVSGTFTITNNPAAGTNKMMYSFPPIKGDVLAPLYLDFDIPDMSKSYRTVVSSSASFDSGGAQTVPYYKSLSAAAKKTTPPTGWTITDTADTTMVSGTARKLTNSTLAGADLIVPTDAVMQTWDGLPPGDYRVFVRVKFNRFYGQLLFWNRPPATGTSLTLTEAAARLPLSIDKIGLRWVDMGVVAMPGGAPKSDTMFGLDPAPSPALWNLGLYSDPARATTYFYPDITFDSILLVPAGNSDTITRSGSVAFPTTYTARHVVLDGPSNRRYMLAQSTHTPGTVTTVLPVDSAGALPVVTPGAHNVLHLLPTVDLDASPSVGIGDDKAFTTAVGFKYFPQYTLDSPAAT